MHQFRRLPLARGWNVYRGGAPQEAAQGRSVLMRAHNSWKDRLQMNSGSRSSKERGGGQLIKAVRVREGD